MVSSAGGVLASGVVGVDRLSIRLVVVAAVPDSRDSGAWSLRIAASNIVLASASFARTACDLGGGENASCPLFGNTPDFVEI